MWSLRVLVLILPLVPTAALPAETPFGLKRRIPWNGIL